MQHSVDCLSCMLSQAVKSAKNHIPDEEERKKLIREIIADMASVDESVTAPYIAGRIQAALRKAMNDPDPYQKDKKYYNEEMLKLEDDLFKIRDSYEDPFAAGLKLAASGNIIDFAPGYDLSREKVMEIIDQTLAMDIPREVLRSFQNDLKNASTFLYLGDNAGEIVFDKIFIATIKNYYPQLDIYFATRGKPILNDVTEEDAYFIGMDKFARIINNGTAIPGTDLSVCSSDFRKVFANSDVIISKGQGNFETLYGSGHKNIYYLFLCKCSHFMKMLNARQNDLMFIKE